LQARRSQNVCALSLLAEQGLVQGGMLGVGIQPKLQHRLYRRPADPAARSAQCLALWPEQCGESPEFLAEQPRSAAQQQNENCRHLSALNERIEKSTLPPRGLSLHYA